MKKSGKQVLAMLLCLTMLLTMLPMSALSFQEEGSSAAPVEELEENKDVPEGENIQPADGEGESGEKIVPVSDGDMSDSASSEAESGNAQEVPAQENSVLTGDEEPSQPENVSQENSVLTGEGESEEQEDEEIDWDGAQNEDTLAPENVGVYGLRLQDTVGTGRAVFYPDAAEETWAQDTVTVKGSDSVCEKTVDGHLRVKAGSTNGKDGGDNSDNWPAVFESVAVNNGLTANGDGKYVVRYKMKMNTVDMFGVFINYTDPSSGHFMGCNNGHWYSQPYGGSGWFDHNDVTLSAGTVYQVEITWDPSAKTAGMKVQTEDGQTTITDFTDSYSSLAGSEDKVVNTFVLVAGKWSAPADYEVWDINYSGQTPLTTYEISGTVTDSEGDTLQDVTVDAGVVTETTDAQGQYTLELPNGSYTLKASKDGFKPQTATVTVNGADISGEDFQLEAAHTVQIPEDGVNDTWVQVAASKKGNAVEPRLENGKLVLEATYENVNNLNADAPAVFINETMNTALAGENGEKFLSFTMVPETKKDNQVPDWLGFGFAIDYNDQVGSGAHSYYIGYPSGEETGWFVEYLGGTGTYPGFTAPNVVPGEPLKVEIRWTADKVTLKLNDTEYALPNNGSHENVPVTNRVGIKLGASKYNTDALQGPRATKLTLSDIHYSGQAEVTGHYVKGKVTESGNGTPLSGATVTASNGTTATCDGQGGYTMILPEADEAYTLTASKDGYEDQETQLTVNSASQEAVLENTNFSLEILPVLSGKVTEADAGDKPVFGATVKLYKANDEEKPFKETATLASGAYRIIGVPSGSYKLVVSAEGYETATTEVTVADQDVTQDVALPVYTAPTYTLSTDGMDVLVAQTFPRVVKYRMKGDLTGELWGQSAELDTIKINDKAVVPKIEPGVLSSDHKKVTYTMVIDSENHNGTNVTATITAELRVGLEDLNDPSSKAASRTLGFYITDVTYPNNDRVDHPVDTIEIPNHSLVSVRSSEPTAAVKGGKLAANTITSGDTSYNAKGNEASGQGNSPYYEDFFAAFVYNDKFSASLASNSAYTNGGAAGDKCYPVRAQFDAKDGGTNVAIGLGSTLWYYDHDITRDEANGDKKLTTDQLSKEQRIIAPLEMPYAKVVITGDANGNGTVDWQDGAIAYRETVMHIPAGGESVANSANLRISMNFGSMATNPFLIALDNVKRVAAHTDGLGQFVLLKGYAGEGHDSNHPQYDNIGERMGGKEDFVTLIREGGELGATFGIHTNASEFYAEAIQEENQVRRNTDGSIHYGWNWLDQGIAINGVYDYASGLQKGRWDDLYQIVTRDLVKDHPFVVYVDVWGNYTSGTENDFMTRALSQNIVSHDGWRIAHEWAYANPYESTFQHWTTDYTYGSYGDKGKLNSEVIRFILNQYKDSFPPDFANYGGAANAPLLGGPAMQGFEGWQGDGEYDLSIYNTYNQMIYTKFLQHYPIVEWIDAANEVNIPYGVDHHTRTDTNTAPWKPEMRIRLSDGKDEIVVTRGLDAELDTQAVFDVSREVEYRSRVVTLNNKIIVEGAPASAGEDNSFPASKATLKYLIPWYWDNKGDRVTAENEKLYHWNAQGGESTWDLPNGWEGLANVMVYELSDQGRGPGKSVSVVNGKVTLTGIKANTGYVVTKGADKGAGPVIHYGTGLHLSDPSFNLDMPRSPWKVEGNGSAMRATNSDGISVLKLIGQVSVSQKLTGLTAGKTYAMYAAVDNRSNAKATMTITDGEGNMVATNYTEKSIARNYISSYYLHNNHGMEKGESYFQNMFLYFTPEAGKEYTLTLSRAAGSGNVYFDDIRTVEYKGSASPVEYDAQTGAATELHQDFENVPQGIWPFVVGPVEGVSDNRTHLSELNAPFSQAGWDVKKMDDVIDGEWSVKVNGLHGRNNLVYQTIPQNFRFEPDKVYTVGFDYELGSAGSYVAVVGDGAYAGLDSLTVHNLEQTLSTTVPGSSGVAGNTTAKAKVGHIEFTVVGAESGQTWVGIYSKENADNQGTSGDEAAFGGYLDFVLDNLTIELAPPEKNELALLLQEADPMVEEVYIETDAGDWNAFVTARQNGHTVFDNDNATQAEVAAALEALKAAMAKLTKAEISISGKVTNANNAAVEGAVLTLENETYFPTGLTVSTAADGTFRFASKSGVELLPGTYHIKAEATGYYVTTTGDIVVTKQAGEKTQDIQMEAEAPGAYVNDFNTGDISMMGPVVEEPVDQLPTTEWVEFNGSGALKVIWNGLGGQAARPINNVVDKTVSFANGTFSFDVTALTTGKRFNVTMRTTAGNNRLTIGQEDDASKWFGEFWGEDGSSGYTGTQNNSGKPYVEPGATRNVRVTLNGTQADVYIDGMSVYSVNLTADKLTGSSVDAITTAGWCGINMSGNEGSEFIVDNIRIIRADPAAGVQNVSGTVTARSGVAVSGAAVELYQGETRIAGTATNALGQYQVSRVAPGNYTIKVSAPFFTGVEEAITVTDGSDLTGKNFTLIPDISSLTDLIAQVEALDENLYTPESWAELAEPLAAAKAIDGASTIAALNTAYRDLSNARDALVEREPDPADYSALRTLYNEMATKAEPDYTAESWSGFRTALEKALEILSKEATQQEIDDAAAALQSAYAALERVSGEEPLSLAVLQAAYDAAKNVTNDNYTDSSWAAFTAARDRALEILTNSDGLTQAQVDAAAKALTDAQQALTRKNGGSSSDSSSEKDRDSDKTVVKKNEDGSVTTIVTKPNGTVTETTVDTDGGKVEKVTTPDKAVEITVTDPQGETLANVAIPAVIPVPEIRFADVPQGHWADEAIHHAAGLELVEGVGNNRYDMETLMTRGSLATVLHRLSQGRTDYEVVFSDVEQGKYYTQGVAWAARVNVVKGVSEDLFAPDQIITREQLAVMLARYAKLIGMDTKADAKALNAFQDGGNAGTWAVDGLAWCVEKGILKGKGGSVLDPTADVSRAEVAVMLDRFIMLIK